MRAKSLLSMLLILVLALGLIPAMPPVAVYAAAAQLSDITVTAENCFAVRVSARISRLDDQRTRAWQSVIIELFDSGGNRIREKKFPIADAHDPINEVFAARFNNLSPSTQYQASITYDYQINYGNSVLGGRSVTSGKIAVTTPALGTPQIGLSLKTFNAAGAVLQGVMTDTGIGVPASQIQSALVQPDLYNAYFDQEICIVQKSDYIAGQPIYLGNGFYAGKIKASYTRARWPSNEQNLFFAPKTLGGLDPDTEYVAQAMLKFKDYSMHFSAPVEFKTYKIPTATVLDPAISAYDIYFSCTLDLDERDELYNITAARPAGGSEIFGRIVRHYNRDDKTVIFHFDGLSPSSTYNISVSSLSRAGKSDLGLTGLYYTTKPAPVLPAVTTGAANHIRSDRARLYGAVTNNGHSGILEHGFVYATQGSGNDTPDTLVIGGTDVVMVNAPLTTQTVPISFSALAAGLLPGVGYSYRAYARNPVGITYGDIQTFATFGPPSVTTGGSSGITPSSVILSGTVVSTGGAAPALRGFVMHKTTTNPVLGGDGVITWYSDVVDASTGTFVIGCEGLDPNSTYYYRAFLQIGSQTYYGSSQSFATQAYASVPSVLLALTQLQTIPQEKAVGATYTVPAGYGAVAATGVVYSTSPNPLIGGSGVTNAPTAPPDLDGAFTVVLTGLSPSTTYYYRAYATNGTDHGYSNQGQFTTPAAPTTDSTAVVTRTEVTAVTPTTATVVTGAHVPVGFVLFYRGILYSSSSDNPIKDAAGVTLVPAGGINGITGGGDLTTELTGLTPDTTYYLRCYTSNAQGENYGSVVTFSTDEAGLPAVVNAVPAAGSITVKSAMVYANIDPNGDTVTRYGVLYSTTEIMPTKDGVSSGITSFNPITQAMDLAYDLIEVESGTTYYCRFFAQNSKGTAYGDVITFTTLPAVYPVLTTATVTAGAATAETEIGITQDGLGYNTLRAVGIVAGKAANPAVPAAGVIKEETTDTAPGGKSFTLHGLDYDTLYYARAYGITHGGTVFYGNEQTFVTLSQPLATVTADGYLRLTGTSVQVFAMVSDDGGSPIAEKGVVYGSAPLPAIGAATKVPHAQTDLGSFTITLTGLTEGQTYYARAYAITAAGTAYSEEQVFTTGVASVTHIVTFDAAGGEGVMTPQAFIEGTAQALADNTFARSGYTFAGWATALGGAVVYSDRQSIAISADTALYAVWLSVPGGGGGYVPPVVYTTPTSQDTNNTNYSYPAQTDAEILVNIPAQSGKTIMLETATGTVTLSPGIIAWLSNNGFRDITFRVSKGCLAVEFIAGGNPINYNNPEAPILVTLPVNPEAGKILNGYVAIKMEGDKKSVYTYSKTENNKISFYAWSTGKYDVIYSAPNFTDVTENAWYRNAVVFASARGLFSGVGNNRFAPDLPMTRAMFAAVMANLEKADLSPYKTLKFTDVDINAWYGPAVAWAAEKGIVNGYDNGKFGPGDEITREQMAVMLNNYIKYRGIALPAVNNRPFADLDSVSPWARDAVSSIHRYGIIGGVGDNIYAPLEKARRSQVAQIFLNFIKAVLR